MGEFALHHLGGGNVADYVFGDADHGWKGFDVVRFHAVEEISRPFEVDVTLARLAKEGPVDLDAMIGLPATLRITTEKRYRDVHGVLAEAEEIERTSHLLLYRVLLVPHLWNARFRRRCRTFVNHTLEEILTMVLENRPSKDKPGSGGLADAGPAKPQPLKESPEFKAFKSPLGLYRWDVADRSRISDSAVRNYVVQYNESDFDFVSRLLEEEGLSYGFEHGDGALIMSITDRPGAAPLFPRDQVFKLKGLAVSGGSKGQEVIRGLREGRRMRSRAVRMRDFDWWRTRTQLQAEVTAGSPSPDLSRHYEFPARDDDVEAKPCLHPSTVRLERFEAERRIAEGTGTVRTMEPGRRFKLHDTDGLRKDHEYLIVRVETFATQLLPAGTLLDREPFGFGPGPAPSVPGYENEFSVVPRSLTYRPAQLTPKPRIDGVQPALVAAEECKEKGVEIHTDPFGRVRVRFPWDERPDDGTPSSKWIRVSQYWAGAGWGALYTPRVGHEVLVAYLQGDPDRPVIVGRVYNAQTPPPYDPQDRPTVSTVKSQSSPKAPDGHNEIRFEDLAHKEEIYLHAQRNLTEVVRASHSTSVGGDQTNIVYGNQVNKVKKDRSHEVDGSEEVTILHDRKTWIGVGEKREVGFDRVTQIGSNEQLNIGANHTLTVGDYQVVVIGKDHVETTAGAYVLTSASVTVTAGPIQDAGEAAPVVPTGPIQISAKTENHTLVETFDVAAGKATLSMSSGLIVLNNGAGASISLVGGKIKILASDDIEIESTGGDVSSFAGGGIFHKAKGRINLSGKKISARAKSTFSVDAGADITIDSDAEILATGTTIKLNG
jgi:type VI secretion system secreted protein VgrG